MIIKFIGAAIIILSGGYLGLYYSKKLQIRIDEIKAFISSLSVMDALMAHIKAPLAEIFLKLSDCREKSLADFFNDVHSGLSSGRGISAAEAFESALARHKGGFSFGNEELAVIGDFGRRIGMLDIDSQRGQISLCTNLLERCLQNAINENEKYGKLYKGMGIAGGIFISLILM